MAATLAEFLQARIAEDEAHAHKDLAMAEAATPGPWRAHVGFNLPHSYLRTAEGAQLATFDGVFHDASVSLAARFHPETVQRRARRVLAECDAKRRIVEAAVWEVKDARRRPGWTIPDSQVDEKGRDYRAGFENAKAQHLPEVLDRTDRLLRLLALPYVDHPDWREEWRP